MTQQAAPPPPKPAPLPQQENEFYWQKCKQHELWLRSCNDCKKAYFYPRDICPHCFSRDTTWVKASGRGTLFTYAIVVRASHPAWRDDVPYIEALVDLAEGGRMPTNLVGIPKDPDPVKMAQHIRVGMPVEVTWEDRTPQISLPMFKPAGG